MIAIRLTISTSLGIIVKQLAQLWTAGSSDERAAEKTVSLLKSRAEKGITPQDRRMILLKLGRHQADVFGQLGIGARRTNRMTVKDTRIERLVFGTNSSRNQVHVEIVGCHYGEAQSSVGKFRERPSSPIVGDKSIWVENDFTFV